MARLSAYRVVWLQVIFDLPVVKKSQRKKATAFRNTLLDLGFQMEQFSVYLRDCSDKSFAEKLMNKIENQLPPEGSVKMLVFTDKQYENVRSFSGKAVQKNSEKHGQLLLF